MIDLDKIEAVAMAAGDWYSETTLFGWFDFPPAEAKFIATCNPATAMEMVAEIRRLVAENQQLLGDANAWAQECKTEQRLSFRELANNLQEQVKQLTAELEAAQKDAARYRFLRGNWTDSRYSKSLPFPENQSMGKPVTLTVLFGGVGKLLDAGIDAAMENAK